MRVTVGGRCGQAWVPAPGSGERRPGLW